MGKYKLRDGETSTPDIYGLGGSIGVDGIVNKDDDYTYEMYLIQNGQRVEKEPIDLKASINEEGNYKFTGLDAGIYAVNIILRDSNKNIVKAIAKEVVVQGKVQEIPPILTNYNKDKTYYVTYENGKEISNIPIGENQPQNWYDYDEDIKATIVVRDQGKETYYEWIPRYQCKIDNANHIMYIPKDKVEPDEGYTIPTEFSKEGQEEGYWKQKADYTNRLTAKVIAGDGKIRISEVKATTTNLSYEISLIQNGKRIIQEEALTGIEHEFKNLNLGQNYIIHIIAKDTNGSVVCGYAKQIEVVQIVVDLSSYDKNTTYYVIRNNVSEESNKPIGETITQPEWYDYAEESPAIIVVREYVNGVFTETYYEWVPRYEYRTSNQSEIMYISTSKTVADEGYTIPTDFTRNGNVPGYWKQIEKYENRLIVTIATNENKITVSNQVTSLTPTKYDIYLIKDGVRQGTGITQISDVSYTFNITEEGKYTIFVEAVNLQKGTIAGYTREVIVYSKLEVPDLTGYRVDTTYIVTYNDDGTENATQTLQEVLAEGAQINEDKTLLSGKIDLNKINGTWYDYTKQVWANIVTQNDGYTNYFTWVPRYAYSLDTKNEKVNAILIPRTITQEDLGDKYTIPEAFTWLDDDENKVQLAGFWIGKYKLRAGP